MQGDRASPREALSPTGRVLGSCMDRAGKLTEREILAVWTTRERDHADISTFRTTSERPGVHENVAVHMIVRTVRGHEACFRLRSCSTHILVCCDLSSCRDNVLCRARTDPQ